MREVIAFIGLGANLETPAEKIDEAIRRIAEGPEIRVVARAPLYSSKPLGPADQADYVNSAAALETSLSPEALLFLVKAVEQAMGRRPSVRWGPRLIDVDILLYGDRVLETDALVIPHPEMLRRRFVLAPLADLAPDVLVPGPGGDRSVRALLESLGPDDGSVRRL